MRQLASVFVKQRNGRKSCREKSLDGGIECDAGSALVRACIHPLHLIDQQRTSGNNHRSINTCFNFSMDELDAILQGRQEAFTQKLLGMTLHDHEDAYADQQSNGNQNCSRDQTNSMLMNFWMWHVFQGRIGRGHETVLLQG